MKKHMSLGRCTQADMCSGLFPRISFCALPCIPNAVQRYGLFFNIKYLCILFRTNESISGYNGFFYCRICAYMVAFFIFHHMNKKSSIFILINTLI